MSTDLQSRLPDPTGLIPELREIGAALYKAPATAPFRGPRSV